LDFPPSRSRPSIERRRGTDVLAGHSVAAALRASGRLAYRSFAQLVVPELVKDGVGVLGMKSLGNGIILRSGAVTAIECLHYALNLPTSVVITGIDSMKILDQAFDAARTFRPMGDADVEALLSKTADAGSRGQYELFKTSSIFDSTATNPSWLGQESSRVTNLMPA
jgi:hypothetical protein